MTLVFVDTETTGLDPSKEEILEVCAVRVDADTRQILETHHKYHAPAFATITPEVINIHGITMEKVAGLPPYMECREELAEFIGKSPVAGHNIAAFDINFLKIKPTEVRDTCLMARETWPGMKNNLRAACLRAGIQFDESSHHGAQYDVMKCIELYWFLVDKKNLNKAQNQPTLFEKPAQLQHTQAYSHSRIKLFQQCPYRWAMAYINHVKTPDTKPQLIGRIIHLVAEHAALWCYSATFGNRFAAAVEQKMLTISPMLKEIIENEINSTHPFYMPSDASKLTPAYVGMHLYQNEGLCAIHMGASIGELVKIFDEKDGCKDAEIVSNPPEEVMDKIVAMAMAAERCSDPEIATDVYFLASKLQKTKDFSIYPGFTAVVEKRFSLDASMNQLKSWNYPLCYFRGIIDQIEYSGGDLVITDYKSGRTMLSEEELKHDMQMKLYVMMVYHVLPHDAITSVTIRHHYIRFGKLISYTFTDAKSVADEAESWLRASINDIEKVISSNEGFPPHRNENCSSCYFFEQTICPLFNVKFQTDISNPTTFQVINDDTLRVAWKSVEVKRAEIKALTSKCKEYVSEKATTAKIDDRAILDFWAKQEREYNAKALTTLLVNKKVELKAILDYLSMTKTNFEKMCEKLGIELTPAELESVSKKKVKTEFDALTEVESKDCLNSRPEKTEAAKETK